MIRKDMSLNFSPCGNAVAEEPAQVEVDRVLDERFAEYVHGIFQTPPDRRVIAEMERQQRAELLRTYRRTKRRK